MCIHIHNIIYIHIHNTIIYIYIYIQYIYNCYIYIYIYVQTIQYICIYIICIHIKLCCSISYHIVCYVELYTVIAHIHSKRSLFICVSLYLYIYIYINIYIYMYDTRGHEELMKNVVNTIKQNIVKINEISFLRIPQHTLW